MNPGVTPSPLVGAAARAEAQVKATRDDPAGRLALVSRTYGGTHGDPPRHLPYRRAALSFMRWQVDRGVLNPLDAEPPGSPWWRAVNERLLRDGCEAAARGDGRQGAPSSSTIAPWLAFTRRPTARNWYAAHNASTVAAYLEHQDLAATESAVERFFLNVVLLRVRYAHALVAAPRLSLGRVAPLGRVLGDPRLGMAGAFLPLGRILPDRYPPDRELDTYLHAEHGLGRLLDYGVITPRTQLLYEWSTQELEQPGLTKLIRDGAPIYTWPFEERRVWQLARASPAIRLMRRALPPRSEDAR